MCVCVCCCHAWSQTSTLYKPVNNELTVSDYLRPLAVINFSTRLKSIKPAQVHHGTGCSVYSGIRWTPLLHAIAKKEKTPAGLDRKSPGWGRQRDGDWTSTDTCASIFFIFLFFNTPKRRKTDAVRGAGASLLLTRPICVLGKNVLSAHVLTGTWKGKKQQKKTASPNNGLRSRSNGSARVRARVRRERYDLSLLCLHTCVLCLSAILKWYLFFQIRPVKPLLSPPVYSLFKIIK